MSKNKNLSMMEINQAAPKFQDESIAPMHTAEHILNQTMVRLFRCGRAVSAHIERKKSKCDYLLEQKPTAEQIQEIENKVNDIISQNLPVSVEYLMREDAEKMFDLSRLPKDVSQTLRIVKIGDYDACPCIGVHVNNTSEIGRFNIVSSDFFDARLRIRFNLLK
jgi:alanine--tRNA ligase